MPDRRVRFVQLHVAWLLGTLLVFVLLDAFDPERYYIVALIGFFFAYELTATAGVSPKWRRRLRWVAVAWVLGFVALVVRNLASIVAEVS